MLFFIDEKNKRRIDELMFLRCSPAVVMSDSHPLRPVSSASEIDHLHLLSEQLGALVPSEEYSDVTFIVEEKRFPAHRVILAARCQYFRLLLISSFQLELVY